jgi:hypothetical protein
VTETDRDRIEDLEKRIADLKARFPAHSVRASMVQELEDLEDRLERARKEAGRLPGRH